MKESEFTAFVLPLRDRMFRYAQSLLLSPFTFVDMTALPLCARAYFPLPAYIESADGF